MLIPFWTILFFCWSYGQKSAPDLPELTLNSEPSFSTSILPLFQSACSIEECHDGIQPPDLRTYQKIFRNKEDIVERLNDVANPMPPIGVPDIRMLKPSEKEMIIKWIENGALEN